ncbi:MAG: phosphatase [Marinifilaceae bacterium]|nr:phosphatase [Marinifilaceae bacterium]
MNSKTLAAIDIGTNAVRLFISSMEEYPTEVLYKKIAFIRVPLRLGDDVFTTGKIEEKKRKRLRETMQGFSYIMSAFNVEAYRAYATCAMREALNGEEIVQELKEASDLNVEIISGVKEAETIFAGGMKEVVDNDKTYLYVDVGGGSTEVVVYSKGTKVDARSFPLGTVRMLNDAVEKGEMKSFKAWLKSIYQKYTPDYIIGSGGNINKVHKLLNKKEKETITYQELEILYKYIKSFNLEERERVLKLNTYRADVIIPAMKIFLTVGKTCQVNEIIVPKLGLSDGIIRILANEIE